MLANGDAQAAQDAAREVIEGEAARIRALLRDGDAEGALTAARSMQSKLGSHWLRHQSYDGGASAWEILRLACTVPVEIGEQVVQADVVNDIFTVTERDYADKVFLIQIASGMSTHFYLAAASSEQGALEAYADNNETCKLTLVTDDDGIDDEDCISLGNASEPHFFEGLAIDEVKAAGPVYVKATEFSAIRVARDMQVGPMPAIEGWEAADRPREELVRPTADQEIFASLVRDWDGRWAALLVNWDGVAVKPTQVDGVHGDFAIGALATRDWTILPDDLTWGTLEEALAKADLLAPPAAAPAP